jgi:hypothetical protein
VCAFALCLKLPWEVYYLNQTIDKVRGFDKAKLAVEYENALKAVCRQAAAGRRTERRSERGPVLTEAGLWEV